MMTRGGVNRNWNVSDVVNTKGLPAETMCNPTYSRPVMQRWAGPGGAGNGLRLPPIANMADPSDPSTWSPSSPMWQG
jgi:hypothetical protein